MSGVEDRLTRVEDRLTNVDDRLTRVEDRLMKVDTRLTRVETKVDGIETKMGELIVRFDRTDARSDLQFRWIVGIQLGTLIAIVGGLFGVIAKLL